MWKRMAAFAVCLFGLTGCILQSEVPLFSDKDATLALGDKDGAARLEDFRDGDWVAGEKPIRIRVDGRHYTAEAENATVTLHFIPLAGEDFVVQGSEDGKPAAYMFGRLVEGRMQIAPIACSDIRNEMRVSRWIRHDGDNCFIPMGSPSKMIFKTLLESRGSFSSRLSIVPQ